MEIGIVDGHGDDDWSHREDENMDGDYGYSDDERYVGFGMKFVVSVISTQICHIHWIKIDECEVLFCVYVLLIELKMMIKSREDIGISRIWSDWSAIMDILMMKNLCMCK